MKLPGRVALITGAARGLGKGYTEALLKHDVKVSIVDILQVEGEATQQELNQKYGAGSVFFIQCDITKQEEFEAAFKRTKDTFGRLDIVVNNAGVFFGQHFQKIMDVNITGAIRGTHLAVENMSQEKGGQGGVIINISSNVGLEPVRHLDFAEYGASKHAIRAFTQSFAAGLETSQSKCGIRVNTLCPAAVLSDMTRGIKEQFDKDPVISAFIDKYGGWLELEELAQGFLRLIEDDGLHNKVLLVEPGKQIFWSQDNSG